MNGLRISGDRVYLELRAVPGASRTELAGFRDGRLRVRIAAAPEDGKANRELTAFFAKLLDCPKKELVLERGEKSRQKTLSFPRSREPQWNRIFAGLEAP
ncbi:MAG: DUF167 domain-containing protein [Treponema sp.]|jgi:uncharacterized protein (TIGR00251 family)|nr:DUF167 domain-containing protein [Treponema sp.]